MLNNKGHSPINFLPVLWAVLIASGLVWIALAGWIIFLIRLIRG